MNHDHDNKLSDNVLASLKDIAQLDSVFLRLIEQTDMQAALELNQLQTFDEYNKHLEKYAKMKDAIMAAYYIEKKKLLDGETTIPNGADTKNDSFNLTEKDIESFIAKEDYYKIGRKTAIVILTLHNGFEIVASEACVNPDDYDDKIGHDLARKKAIEKVWELAGYMTQEDRYRLQNRVSVKGTVAPIAYNDTLMDIEAKGYQE